MPWPIDALPYPFELGFMQRALVASVVVGVFAPMIGTFVVQKKMSLIGDGIGHLAFAGVGAGLVAGVSPIWAALAVAVAGALGIEWLRSRRTASGDLALALFFYSGIAAGVVLVSLGRGFGANLLTLPVRPAAHRERPGDRDHRRARSRDRRRRCWCSVAACSRSSPTRTGPASRDCRSASSTRSSPSSWRCRSWPRCASSGLLLVAAMMVLPVASGQLLARSFRGTMWWSVAIGVASVVAGLAASRIWGLAPGGTIVLISAAIFAVVALVRRATVPKLQAEGAGL